MKNFVGLLERGIVKCLCGCSRSFIHYVDFLCKSARTYLISLFVHVCACMCACMHVTHSLTHLKISCGFS